jgi:hypothetical protein
LLHASRPCNAPQVVSELPEMVKRESVTALPVFVMADQPAFDGREELT